MSKDLFFKQRQEELALLIERTEQGEISSLKMYGQLKQMGKMYADAERQILEQVLEESTNYFENTFKTAGFEFTKRSGATRFSYKEIEEWQINNKALKNCEAKYKQAFISKQNNLLVAS